MPKKRDIKKYLIIALMLLVTILAVRAVIQYAIDRANMSNKTYTSMSDFTSIKEIAEYMGCKYIKEEDSTSDVYDIDIYLKFKYPLYTEEVSNEEYYYRMIALMLGFVDYRNIRLIDMENDIVIAVQADREEEEIISLLINGEDNYFGKADTKKLIENYENFQVISMEPESPILKELIANNWAEKSVDFGTQESTYCGYKVYFDEGIEAKIIANKVFHLVFTENYKGNIVNGLNVNSDEETIKQVLGEPDMRINKLNTLGYRGENLYIFFNTTYHEVSVYRRQHTTEQEKEKLKRMLVQLSVDGNAMVFASDMTDMWSDYDKFEYTNGYISLQYSLRGIKFEANVTENNGIILYNNYTGTLIKDLKNGEEIPFIYLEDKDLIYEFELNYELEESAIKYRTNMELTTENKYLILDVSQDFRYKELLIISLDGTSYNFDFYTKVNSYIWLDEYNFAFSIENKGIYRYNILTKETQKIIEGEELFNLIEYSNGHLKYDDKELIYVLEY